MKIKISTIVLALATMVINIHGGTSNFPAPLPQFMNKEQLAKWNAEQASAAQAAATPQENCGPFYTGKPYVSEAGGYVYKYRTYSPEINRWTSADPSGFPDGANNQLYGKQPNGGLDPDGLTWTIGVGSASPGYGQGQFTANGADYYIYSNSTISGTVTGTGTASVSMAATGSITTNSLFPTTVGSANVSAGLSVTVDTATGAVSVSPAGGGSYTSSGTGGLQVDTNSSYSVAQSSPTQEIITVYYHAGSAYNGSGQATSIGFTGAGVGANVSWTTAPAQQDSYTTITFVVNNE